MIRVTQYRGGRMHRTFIVRDRKKIKMYEMLSSLMTSDVTTKIKWIN